MSTFNKTPCICYGIYGFVAKFIDHLVKEIYGLRLTVSVLINIFWKFWHMQHVYVYLQNNLKKHRKMRLTGFEYLWKASYFHPQKNFKNFVSTNLREVFLFFLLLVVVLIFSWAINFFIIFDVLIQFPTPLFYFYFFCFFFLYRAYWCLVLLVFSLPISSSLNMNILCKLQRISVRCIPPYTINV